MNSTGNLFMMVKACVGPATLLGWADNRRMVNHCTTNFSNSTPQVWNSKIFFPHLYRLAYQDPFPIAEERREIHTFLKALAQIEMLTDSSRIWTQFIKCISYEDNHDTMHV